MVKPCLLLLAGGLAAQHSTVLLRSDFAAALLVASVLALCLRYVRGPAWFVAGAAAFLLAAASVVEGRLDPDYAGDSMLAVVRVVDFPQSHGRSVSFTAAPLDDRRIPSRIRVSWFDALVVPIPGEVWELELRLRQPRGNANPGVFDHETWLFREKLRATGYVVPGERNRLLWSADPSAVAGFRRRFIATVRAAADSDSATAVLVAVATGERHLVSRRQWDAFAATGTTHLMAISGLHVGLAATFAFSIAFVATGGLRCNRVVAALLAAVCAAALYAWIAGLGVPARRAVIMLAASALTVARRRQIDVGAVVGLAVLAVYAADPIASMTPGFHLSFGAVLLLLWLSRRRQTGKAAWHPVRAIHRLATMQVFLLFGLLPLTALIFQRFSLASLPVNVVAVPVFSFVTVPLTLLALCVSGFSEVAAMHLLRYAAASVDGLEAVVEFAAKLPFAHFHLASVGAAASLLPIIPLAWAVLPPGWPARRVALLGAAAVVVWQPPPPPGDCFDAWVLDVGQGLAVAVQTRHEVVVYDTGMAWRGGGSAARQTITPFLRSRGVGRIDRLVVSHADLDHSGGARELLEAFEVRHVLLGEVVNGVPGWRCREGQAWWSGAIRFDVLHPVSAGEAEGNDASCVIRVSAGAHAMLLTGDIERAAERELVARRAPLGADVVVVPHHGSGTSSSSPFVDSVQADVAVVSAAWASRWGFPKDAVVERWAARESEVLNTARDGAVSLRICAAGGLVETRREREERRRVWHARD